MTHKTVSEVAALAGITVRTLHHYDEIGLLRPNERTDAGYRLYDEQDLVRLHDILLWRSLGFPLDEVRALVDDPGHDVLEALFVHRERLVAEVGKLNERIAALDDAIRKARSGERLEEVDLVAIFDGFDPAAFEAEVQQTWGDTEPYRESKARAARYGEAEWRAIKAEAEELTQRMAALQAAGVAPSSAEAIEAAEAHRQHISRWFYECTPEIHRGLADLYESDPRFRRTYEKISRGLQPWVTEAIRALHAPRTRRL